MRSARFGFNDERNLDEHRGSRPRMDDLLSEAASDPLFHDAAFRGFEPETPDQAEAFRQKLQGFPEEMRPRILQHLGGRR